MPFQIKKWSFFLRVNITFLTYLICIVMSESDMMERSEYVLLCWEETVG